MNKADVKAYALLSAFTYPKRQMKPKKSLLNRNKFFKKTRKVDMNSVELRDYIVVDEFTSQTICTFQNVKNNTIVLAIRGTDLTRPEDADLYTDALLIYGKEQTRKRYTDSFAILKKIKNLFKNFKIIITGHSLGGRIAIDLLDSELGKFIHEVHVFNAATSISHLYKSNECFLSDTNQKRFL